MFHLNIKFHSNGTVVCLFSTNARNKVDSFILESLFWECFSYCYFSFVAHYDYYTRYYSHINSLRDLYRAFTLRFVYNGMRTIMKGATEMKTKKEKIEKIISTLDISEQCLMNSVTYKQNFSDSSFILIFNYHFMCWNVKQKIRNSKLKLISWILNRRNYFQVMLLFSFEKKTGKGFIAPTLLNLNCQI